MAIRTWSAHRTQASRLTIFSAGNIRGHLPQQMRDGNGRLDHLPLCDLSGIEEPESPFSRTSVALTNPAVTKPDIVLEGGNLLVATDGSFLDPHELLRVPTTHHDAAHQLAWTNATSAATAQAAALAATAMSTYPGLRAETVSALLVHEAQWTPAMVEPGLFKKTGSPKLAKGEVVRQVIRRYGWGVPTADRIRSSASHAVTMIIQNTLVPLKRAKGQVRPTELKPHEPPWPLEELRDLTETTVDLRVGRPRPGPRPHPVR
ncbi:S8 family serine peptidase [Streptomyces sp. NPDC002773]|uniref:S8 family serine peptidase n=1 Tax=Streptomyces sp. NPDC002773 TaxID=3154430 RepID=UPI003334627D